MNTRDFCYWLQGYCELTNCKQPTVAVWKLIVEHLELTAYENVLTTKSFNDFVETLQGFLDINGVHKISADQWNIITAKLQDCFEKVTSELEDLEEGNKGQLDTDELQKMLEDIMKERDDQPRIYPPYLPQQPNPFNPFPGPSEPWKAPDIICSDGTNHNPLEGMPTSTCEADSKAFCASVPDVACNVVEMGESLVNFAREVAQSELEDAYDSHAIDERMIDGSYWK